MSDPQQIEDEVVIRTPQEATAARLTWDTDSQSRVHRTQRLCLFIDPSWSPLCIEALTPIIEEGSHLVDISVEFNDEDVTNYNEPGGMTCMILNAAEANLAIQKLCLYRVVNQPSVGRSLGRLLRRARNLRLLRLVDVGFANDTDLGEVTQGLGANRSLENIEFSSFFFEDPRRSLHEMRGLLLAGQDVERLSVDSFSWSWIFEEVAAQASWRELHLNNCSPESHEEFDSLLRAFNENQNLHTLRLCSVEIASPEAFGNWLSNQRHIQTLELSGIFLDTNGFRNIVGGLQRNRSVSHLKLQGSFYNPDYSIAIRSLLIQNQGIRRLDLSHSEMPERLGEDIAFGLQFNSRMRELDLSGITGLSLGGIMSIMLAAPLLDVRWTNPTVLI